MDESSVWNSLEITKISISIILPIIGVYLAYKVNSLLKNRDKALSVYNHRIKMYEICFTKINAIYCFLIEIGDYKKYNIDQVIQLKRETDIIIYSKQYLISDAFLKSYNNFMNQAFELYTGQDKDARIRLSTSRRERYLKINQNEDKNKISNKKNEKSNVIQAYKVLIERARNSIGIINADEI